MHILHILIKIHFVVQRVVEQKQKDYKYIYISNILHFQKYSDTKKIIKNCKSILNKLNVKYDLAHIEANFSCIIKKFENSNLSLVDLLNI